MFRFFPTTRVANMCKHLCFFPYYTSCQHLKTTMFSFPTQGQNIAPLMDRNVSSCPPDIDGRRCPIPQMSAVLTCSSCVQQVLLLMLVCTDFLLRFTGSDRDALYFLQSQVKSVCLGEKLISRGMVVGEVDGWRRRRRRRRRRR